MPSSETRVTSVDKIPSGEHWAIIENSSVYHEGDERSSSHPGHGYPGYSEDIVTYTAYTNREEFEANLKMKLSDRSFGHKAVKGIHISGTFVSETVIHLKEK